MLPDLLDAVLKLANDALAGDIPQKGLIQVVPRIVDHMLKGYSAPAEILKFLKTCVAVLRNRSRAAH